MRNKTDPSLTWYMCPKCNGKLLVIQKDTRVENLPCMCKHCKKKFIINIEPFEPRMKSVIS